jgi:hypothetical protein
VKDICCDKFLFFPWNLEGVRFKTAAMGCKQSHLPKTRNDDQIPVAHVVMVHYDEQHKSGSCRAAAYVTPPIAAATTPDFQSMGLTVGLANEIHKSNNEFAKRYWIVDNSGSMITSDGNAFIDSGQHSGMIDCSRWHELTQTLKWVGNLAIDMCAPLEIFPLNPIWTAPLKGQCISLGYGKPQEERIQLNALCASSPSASTPICAQIRAVIKDIQSQTTTLRRNGQRAVVAIATDGLSTDGDVSAALKPLEDLPVWVVIKLCTDEEKVVNFWNNIDSELELEIDVLDDIEGEAQEVHTVNPWLAYNPVLHRVREWGSSNKLLDMIDEVKFSSTQVYGFVRLVLGEEETETLVQPALDAKGFVEQTARLLKDQLPVWGAFEKSKAPWFSVEELQKKLSK